MPSATTALKPSVCAHREGLVSDTGSEGLGVGDWVVLEATSESLSPEGDHHREGLEVGEKGEGGWSWHPCAEEDFGNCHFATLSPDRSSSMNRVHEWLHNSPLPSELAEPSPVSAQTHQAGVLGASKMQGAWGAVPPATALGFPSFVPAPHLTGVAPCGLNGPGGFHLNPAFCSPTFPQDALDSVSDSAQNHCEALITSADRKAGRVSTGVRQPCADPQDQNLVDFLCAQLLQTELRS
mmetsp:Transcript_4504/g.10893  ORF Transcript_4504/g.10893 Transcript_4504/m.10893 type:complete len:238 (-) Transcript_4504:280-993(-)